MKKGLDPTNFDLEAASVACVGFSGAEIEVTINEAVLEAAVKNERLTQHYLVEEIQKTNPISRTMKEQIDGIRTWASTQNVRRVSEESEFSGKKIGF